MPYIIPYDYHFNPLEINTCINAHERSKNINVTFNEVVVDLTQKMHGI